MTTLSALAGSRAQKCWQKCRPWNDGALFIPGDLDDTRYSFTVVPAYFFDTEDA
jgi:hypothetical protein